MTMLKIGRICVQVGGWSSGSPLTITILNHHGWGSEMVTPGSESATVSLYRAWFGRYIVGNSYKVCLNDSYDPASRNVVRSYLVPIRYVC